MIPKGILGYLSAAILCLSVGGTALMSASQTDQDALSVMSTGFEYDETLGRLQYVSNIFPESAMVFLTNDTAIPMLNCPASTQTLHAWTQAEPWIEYLPESIIRACEAGEVMTIVKNRDDEYTVRLLHQNGYESVYSGLSSLDVHENSEIAAGGRIGYANASAGFELRKDGLSILPVFSDTAGGNE